MEWKEMKSMKKKMMMVVVTLGTCGLGAGSASAEVVMVDAAKDNTLYFDSLGSLSNGAGDHIYAGLSGAGPRRALLEFDVAAAVPAGATINSVTLTLTASRISPTHGTQTYTLHRVLQEWGEGGSNAGEPGGMGTAAQPGDATWLHTFYEDQFWTNEGGDFEATASAMTDLDDLGPADWTGAGLVADVQGWLDSPAENHGWMLRGNETLPGRAMRFYSGDAAFPGVQPVLLIDYTLVPAPGALALLGLAGLARSRRRRGG